jgi:hypothetical protein
LERRRREKVWRADDIFECGPAVPLFGSPFDGGNRLGAGDGVPGRQRKL